MAKKFVVTPPGSRKATYCCTVKVRRCIARAKTHRGACRRKTTILPLCAVHTTEILGVHIKPVPGMGRGLFASVPMRSGVPVAPMGIASPQSLLDENCDTGLRYGGCTIPYGIQLHKDGPRFDFACDTGAGSIANHTSKGLSNVRYSMNTATIRERIQQIHEEHGVLLPADVPWILTTKNIKKDAEIRACYGNAYKFNTRRQIHARYVTVGKHHRVVQATPDECRALWKNRAIR